MRPAALMNPPNEDNNQALAAKKASLAAVRFSMGVALAMTNNPDWAEPMNRNTRP